MTLTTSMPSATNGTKHTNESTTSFPKTGSEPKSPEMNGATLYDRNWENEMESLLKVQTLSLSRTQSHDVFLGNLYGN